MTTTRPGAPAPRTIELESVLQLYRSHADTLGAARDAQRSLLSRRDLRPKLDDLEAEITYLLVRAAAPARIVEIGTFHGWSTSWLLRALADNGHGHLHSYDIVDHAVDAVPEELAEGRWTFHHGDVRTAADLQPSTIGYLFVDAAHTARFARWYVADLLQHVDGGTPVSVHDVYHRRRAGRFSEGRVVLDWLARRRISHFTASARAAPRVYGEIQAVRRSLGLSEVVHRAAPNPMIYFTVR